LRSLVYSLVGRFELRFIGYIAPDVRCVNRQTWPIIRVGCHASQVLPGMYAVYAVTSPVGKRRTCRSHRNSEQWKGKGQEQKTRGHQTAKFRDDNFAAGSESFTTFWGVNVPGSRKFLLTSKFAKMRWQSGAAPLRTSVGAQSAPSDPF